tara:strand:- start:1438 stop:1629 length:192 start_codon:yes stop_codon:yes gene_type:complete
MTQDQAIKEIISKPKYYIGVMPQGTAASFVRSWRAGSAKKETIRKFLNRFGYTIKKEEQWERK